MQFKPKRQLHHQNRKLKFMPEAPKPSHQAQSRRNQRRRRFERPVKFKPRVHSFGHQRQQNRRIGHRREISDKNSQFARHLFAGKRMLQENQKLPKNFDQ